MPPDAPDPIEQEVRGRPNAPTRIEPGPRCESCGAGADVKLDDGSTWCDGCDEAARDLGYDDAPSGYDADEHEKDCRTLCPIDVGGDHAIGWTPTGDLHWLHRCTGDDYSGPHPWRWSVGTIDITSGTRHTLRKRLPVDVGGSILCVGCGDHWFLNDGRYVKC